MRPEDKLKYLREWMEYFIDFRVEQIRSIEIVFEMFDKFGIIPFRNKQPELISFQNIYK